MHLARQIAMLELDRGKVDRDLQRLGPGGRLATRLTQDPLADGDDEAPSSATGMKTPGGTVPRVGWFQRMRASNPMTSPSMRAWGW